MKSHKSLLAVFVLVIAIFIAACSQPLAGSKCSYPGCRPVPVLTPVPTEYPTQQPCIKVPERPCR